MKSKAGTRTKHIPTTDQVRSISDEKLAQADRCKDAKSVLVGRKADGVPTSRERKKRVESQRARQLGQEYAEKHCRPSALKGGNDE